MAVLRQCCLPSLGPCMHRCMAQTYCCTLRGGGGENGGGEGGKEDLLHSEVCVVTASSGNV